MAPPSRLPLALLALAASGCDGRIGALPGGAGAPEGSAPPDGPAPIPAPRCAPGENPPVPAPLRRLTRREYARSVQDVFGLDETGAELWPRDAIVGGLDNDVSGQAPTAAFAEASLRGAEAAAAGVVAELARLLPCASEGDDPESCLGAFLDRYAPRLFRRPLQPSERDAFLALAAATLADGTLADAVYDLTTALLLAPQFLYRLEVGRPAAEPGRRWLTDHEVATRLSFLLTGAPPDQALLARAEAGALRTGDEVRAAAEALLDDPRAGRGLDDFFGQLLSVERLRRSERDPEAFPAFDADARDAMERALLGRVRHVVLDPEAEGTLRELLTSRRSLVDAELAPFYGLDPEEHGETLEWVDVSHEPRAGVLTEPGLMTALANGESTSPVARGLFVVERLLCTHPPPPPADADIEVPPPDPTLTTRERFAAHRDAAACRGCHALFDPPGFALEAFDAVGRFRRTENGRPIDTRGELVGPDGHPYAFDDAADLATQLAADPHVSACLAEQWFAWAHGRAPRPEDACALDALEEVAAAPEARLREVLLTLASSDAFRSRPDFAPATEGCAP